MWLGPIQTHRPAPISFETSGNANIRNKDTALLRAIEIAVNKHMLVSFLWQLNICEMVLAPSEHENAALSFTLLLYLSAPGGVEMATAFMTKKKIPSPLLIISLTQRLQHILLLPASLGLLALLLVGSSARAQPRQAGEAETEARINLLLPKLSLDEKLSLIGGVDSMFIRAVPAIGLPTLKMSDGPLGIRTWGPAVGT